jgi:acyl-CoA dehydrogenase
MFQRTLFREEHEMFRDTVRKFIEKEIAPFHAQWEKDKCVPRELWLKAGEAGMLCCTVPEQYGGLGLSITCSTWSCSRRWRAAASPAPDS